VRDPLGLLAMIDPKDRWLLERDGGGEVRTFAETTEQSISDALDTCYAALYDTADESCVWCIGEPNRRIIEIRTFPDPLTASYGVVARECSTRHNTTVQALGHILNVSSDEVRTREQAEIVFRAFFYLKSIPPGFCALAKSYLFGPGT